MCDEIIISVPQWIAWILLVAAVISLVACVVSIYTALLQIKIKAYKIRRIGSQVNED